MSNIFFNESVINVREMPDDNIVTLNLFTDGSFANDQTIQIFTTNGTAIGEFAIIFCIHKSPVYF